MKINVHSRDLTTEDIHDINIPRFLDTNQVKVEKMTSLHDQQCGKFNSHSGNVRGNRRTAGQEELRSEYISDIKKKID
ncbi:MAG: hypothetical protein LUQ07_04720 [Methanospirillum sp.]|nr:hypothetical protein [Methanospirillum sp.]